MPLSKEAASRKDRAQPTSANFEHRHYAEIARIIRALRRDGDSTSDFDADRVARHFAHELNSASANANFNAARFLAACEA